MLLRTSFATSTNKRKIHIFYKVCGRYRHKPAIHRLVQVYGFIVRQVGIILGETEYFGATVYRRCLCNEQISYGGFIWVENVEDTDFYKISDDEDFGYFVEIDLKYPETLHDSHKDLPFFAEYMAPPGSKQH